MSPKRKLLAQIRSIVTHHKPSYAESQLNKSFFLTVLAATATKRDAKAYIEKYQKPYTRAQAVRVKSSKTLEEFLEADDGALIDVEPSLAQSSPVRVALIMIRDTAEVKTDQLRKFANTLAQLHRLGMHPVVIIENEANGRATGHDKEVNRFAQILESIDLEARPISEGLFAINKDKSLQPTMHKKAVMSIYDTRILKAPVIRRQVPVIRTLAIDENGRKRLITADAAMKALCAAFGASPTKVQFQQDMKRSALVIDKLIILDKVGGIVSPQRKEGSHVFINLDQEALTLQRELATLTSPDIKDKHLRNLDTCQICLDLLTDTASAVITTATIAGSMPGTQHPLIHNLLTDKPMFSPSLPVHGSRTPVTATTILRKGVPVTIHRNISLSDPRIDLKKLQALINDSFGRTLDVDAYLERIKGHVEAIIIAGDYHGAAIITSELVCTTTESASGDLSTVTVPYLDKFAVLRSKQGAGGVADILFNSLTLLFPESLTWRSRNENPVNKWYFERATGTIVITDPETSQKWRVFWTGTPGRERMEQYIQVARKIRPTWIA